MSKGAQRICGINMVALVAAYEAGESSAATDPYTQNPAVQDAVATLKSLSASVGLDYDAEFKAFDKTRSDLQKYLEEVITAADLDKERAEFLDKQLELGRSQLAKLAAEEAKKQKSLKELDERLMSTRFQLSNNESNSLSQMA